MKKLVGLPALPEGYFWRIKNGFYADHAMRIEIRKKLWVGSWRIDWMSFVVEDDDGATAEHLFSAASRLLEEFWKNGGIKARRNELRGDFIS